MIEGNLICFESCKKDLIEETEARILRPTIMKKIIMTTLYVFFWLCHIKKYCLLLTFYGNHSCSLLNNKFVQLPPQCVLHELSV